MQPSHWLRALVHSPQSPKRVKFIVLKSYTLPIAYFILCSFFSWRLCNKLAYKMKNKCNSHSRYTLICPKVSEAVVTQSTFPLARFRIDLDFELNRRVSSSLCYWNTVTYMCVSTRHYKWRSRQL